MPRQYFRVCAYCGLTVELLKPTGGIFYHTSLCRVLARTQRAAERRAKQKLADRLPTTPSKTDEANLLEASRMLQKQKLEKLLKDE